MGPSGHFYSFIGLIIWDTGILQVDRLSTRHPEIGASHCPTVPSPPNQTQNVVLIITMHSHPFHAMSPCICNAMCHFMPIPCHIYDEFYMDNYTHACHPCIMDNYINHHKISKRTHISCQHICTHIYQHQQVITNKSMTYFIL